MDIPFSELFIDELRDFLLFFQQKGNQSTLFQFECVFLINSMVPWFPEREPTSSFLREDVEIGMVAWGYEFLGSVHRFLGDRSLNLGLMDEF